MSLKSTVSISMFGDTVFKSFDEAGVKVLHSQEMDTVDFNDITKLALELPNKAQAVIGMGGGKVIDAAKYAGYLRKLPFFSVPTSSSCRTSVSDTAGSPSSSPRTLK